MLEYFIFLTNVLQCLEEQGKSKHDLSRDSGVSVSFISDLTTGRGNPSLKVMAKIAAALNTPLPLLLERCDLPPDAQELLAGHKPLQSLPHGFQRVSLILTDYQAFVAKKWAQDARKLMPS